jgi:chromate transporter
MSTRAGDAVGAMEALATPVSLWPLCVYFLKLGATGFGGPIALAGFMQRDLVDERGWITRDEYLDGLALAQLAPGPLAAQLAIYLGYVRHGALGGALVALAFILPSFLLVWLLSFCYVRYGGLAWMQAVFYGVGSAVIGIIARSTYKLMRLVLPSRALPWIIFVVAAIATAWFEREIIWLFLLAGVVSLVAVRRPPASPTPAPAPAPPPLALAVTFASAALAPVAPAAAITSTSTASLFWYFVQAGAFVFGSGLAIVPFLYGGVVQEHHWLTDRQFLDAVAVAMITPGPVVITVAFIGYLVDGVRGMTAAAVGVFLPVYLFVVIPAPYFRRYAREPRVRAFVQGVTAAATGAIAGAAVVLARRAFVDPWTVLLAAITLVALMRWRMSELWLIAAAALVGLIAHGR